MIYYGASGFPSTTQNSIIQEFINNISAHTYWSIVKKYYYQQYGGGPKSTNNKIYIASTTTINCATAPQGCALEQNDVQDIVIGRFNAGLPKNQNAIYLVIGGPTVREQYV